MNEGLTSVGDIESRPLLSSLVIPSAVTELGDITYCSLLEEITFPQSLDVSHVTFANCPKYKGTLVGDVYMIGTKLTGYKGDKTFVVVPDTVQSIAANALTAANIKYVYVPSNVKSVENGAFSNIAVLLFEGSNKYGVNNTAYMSIGDACSADGWVYGVSGGNARIYAYIGACGEVSVPAQIDGKNVTELGSHSATAAVGAFLRRADVTKLTFVSATLTVSAGTMIGLENLEEIAFADTVKMVAVSKAAYEGCSNLQRIVLADYDGYQVVEITQAGMGAKHDVTDGANVLATLNAIDDLTPCAIIDKTLANM